MIMPLQLGLRLFALVDLDLQADIGDGQVGGAFFDADFQFVTGLP